MTRLGFYLTPVTEDAKVVSQAREASKGGREVVVHDHPARLACAQFMHWTYKDGQPTEGPD